MSAKPIKPMITKPMTTSVDDIAAHLIDPIIDLSTETDIETILEIRDAVAATLDQLALARVHQISPDDVALVQDIFLANNPPATNGPATNGPAANGLIRIPIVGTVDSETGAIRITRRTYILNTNGQHPPDAAA